MKTSLIGTGLMLAALLAGCQSASQATDKQTIDAVLAQEFAQPVDTFKEERDASLTATKATRAGSGIREKAYVHVIDNRHYQKDGVSGTDLTSYLPPADNLKAKEAQKRQALRAKGATRDKSVYTKDKSIYHK